MRKQDRIAHEQGRPQEPKHDSQSEQREQERTKGKAPETHHPERQGGKLPLPD